MTEIHTPTPEECDIIAEMATVCQFHPDALDEWIEIFCLSDKEDREGKIRWCQATIKLEKPPYEAIVKDMLKQANPENLKAIQEGVHSELSNLRQRRYQELFTEAFLAYAGLEFPNKSTVR